MPSAFRRRRTSPIAFASAVVGAVMRTISQPTSTNLIVWASVASMSWVRVVVIDWTRMGFVPPTATLPIWTSRDLRRWYANRLVQYVSGAASSIFSIPLSATLASAPVDGGQRREQVVEGDDHHQR